MTSMSSACIKLLRSVVDNLTVEVAGSETFCPTRACLGIAFEVFRMTVVALYCLATGADSAPKPVLQGSARASPCSFVPLNFVSRHRFSRRLETKLGP